MNDPRHAQPLGARPLGTPAPSHPQAVTPSHRPQITPAPAPVQPVIHDDLEPIGLAEEASVIDAAIPKKITAFGTMGSLAAHEFKRKPHCDGKGICRVRTFHGRLSDQGLEYLDMTINDWLDAHPEIDVKAVTTNTNMFDGKVKELTLIVNVWY